MIQNKYISDVVKEFINGTGLFTVEISIKPGNHITILIDSMTGVTIEQCAELSRLINSSLNRDEEDYELEVSSPGLLHPFKVKEQYHKNIGHEVEILSANGQKSTGKLISVDENYFTTEIQKKVKTEDSKKPRLITEQQQFKFDEVKSAKIVINF